ncbi:MFS transporter [Chloroflexota bacterium]
MVKHKRSSTALTGTEKPKLFYGWTVVAASFCIMLVIGGIVSIFGVFFKPLSTDFGWTRTIISGAFSLYSLLFGIAAIITGRLNDKFGPRILLTVCGLFAGLGFLLMSQISTIWHLYLFFGVLIAIGNSGFWSPIVSTLARWFVKRRGMVIGIAASGAGLGRTIMPLLATWLISIYGWRNTSIIISILVLVLVLSAAQLLKRDPRQIGQLPYGESEVEQESLVPGASGFSLKEVIHTRQFWMLCAAYLLFGICTGTILVHLVPHAIDLGISAAVAAGIMATTGGIYIVGTIIMGGVADRIGNRLTFISAFIVLVASFAWLLVAKEMWMLHLFAVIFASAWAGIAVLQSMLVAESFGMRSLSLITGILVFSFSIGSTIGPTMAGYIFDTTGSYQRHFLISVAVSTISLILVFFLRPISEKEGTS